MFDRCRDHLQHALAVGQYIVIVEAQHAIAPRREEGITAKITLKMLGLEVLTTIDFNHQTDRVADKVRNIWADRNLSSKVRAIYAVCAQCVPNASFSVSRISAQRTSSASLLRRNTPC